MNLNLDKPVKGKWVKPYGYAWGVLVDRGWWATTTKKREDLVYMKPPVK
jgi:hypothetical protein